MNRLLTALIAIAMVVSITGPAMAIADSGSSNTAEIEPLAQTNDTDVNNTTANETKPGLHLAASVAVQQQELQGEIEHRSFGLEVAAAATNDSKAQVLNRTQEHLESRLTELEQEQAQMNASLANGTISESQYQVGMSALVTKTSNLERMANSTSQTAETLSNETLEANGVNATALMHIRTQAHNMTGPETAAMARQIAGNNVGMPMGPPQGVPRGPPADMPGGNQSGEETDRQMGSNGTDGGMMDKTTTTTTTQNETTSHTTTEVSPSNGSTVTGQ
ncbi:hypothetical protein [Halodesulfurarchaeum sp.]|uniref:hypothetical protein n=1 Tax=Halodesulfurarchaeum sp. TaxID=1980530 RepID=UPI001BBB43A7|nr:hypothetical protein [Halodesulfurarchaeum sp.]